MRATPCLAKGFVEPPAAAASLASTREKIDQTAGQERLDMLRRRLGRLEVQAVSGLQNGAETLSAHRAGAVVDGGKAWFTDRHEIKKEHDHPQPLFPLYPFEMRRQIGAQEIPLGARGRKLLNHCALRGVDDVAKNGLEQVRPCLEVVSDMRPAHAATLPDGLKAGTVETNLIEGIGRRHDYLQDPLVRALRVTEPIRQPENICRQFPLHHCVIKD